MIVISNVKRACVSLNFVERKSCILYQLKPCSPQVAAIAPHERPMVESELHLT